MKILRNSAVQEETLRSGMSVLRVNVILKTIDNIYRALLEQIAFVKQTITVKGKQKYSRYAKAANVQSGT